MKPEPAWSRSPCAFARALGILGALTGAGAMAQGLAPGTASTLWSRALELAQPAPLPDPAEAACILPPTAEIDRQVLPAVRKALGDPDPGVRGEALLTLGALGGRDDLATVRGFLKDPDQGLRQRAILALGMLQDPATVSTLAHGLEGAAGDPRERALALLALGLLPDGAGHARIAEHLATLRGRNLERSREELLAGMLALALRPDGTGRGILETLLDDASLRDPALRAAALTALAAVAPAAPQLVRGLTDRSAEVRLAATLAVAMGREHGPGDSAGRVGETLRRLVRDADPAVRAGALVALGCRRDGSAPGVAQPLASGSDDLLRPFALLCLGLAGGETERRDLRARLDLDLAPATQAATVQALAALGDLGVAQRLRDRLTAADADATVRAAAAAALGQLRDTRALPILREQFFRSDDPELLLAFALAARRIAPREGIARDPEPLEPGAARPAWARYLVQVRALAAAGSRGLKGVLLKLLTEADAGAHGRAIALAGLRDYLAPAARNPGALLARLPARPGHEPLLRDVETWFAPGR